MAQSELEKATNTFRGLGVTVIILGLLTFMFLEGASQGLTTAAYVFIAACVITGGLLAGKPSVVTGLAAGISLALLGVVDTMLVMKDGGLGFIAPVVDFLFAARVLYGCYTYAQMTNTADSEGRRDPEEME